MENDKKLNLFAKNEALAIFAELLDLNKKTELQHRMMDEHMKTMCDHMAAIKEKETPPFPEIPPVPAFPEIPETDLSGVISLLKAISQKLDKTQEVSAELRLYD